MDILFVDLPFDTYEFGEKYKDTSAESYKKTILPNDVNIGFRYMVSYLQKNGVEADIFFPGKIPAWKNKNDLVEEIARINPPLLGFTAYEGNLPETIGFIKKIKAAGVGSRICLGGQLATFSYQEIFRDFSDLIDIIVVGEGEGTILEVVEAVKKGKDLAGIAGVAVKELTSRPLARQPLDVNALPFPIFNITDEWQQNKIPLFVTSSRGCYGRCSFCRTAQFTGGWRPRAPQNVVDEVEQAVKKGVFVFEFVDDNFIGPGREGRARAQAIAREILRRKLSINFHISCRVNDIEEETIKLLKAAGLFSISLGVESGVQTVLDRFHKGITVQQCLDALVRLEKNDLRATVYIIFFDPYMTLTDAKENLDFLIKLKGHENVRFENIIFRKLIPLTGTLAIEQLQKDGLLRGNYFTGHHFIFKNAQVALLSDFLENIDYNFESIYLSKGLDKVKGLYDCFKREFEFEVAEQAIDLIQQNWPDDGGLPDKLNNLYKNLFDRAFPAS